MTQTSSTFRCCTCLKAINTILKCTQKSLYFLIIPLKNPIFHSTKTIHLSCWKVGHHPNLPSPPRLSITSKGHIWRHQATTIPSTPCHHMAISCNGSKGTRRGLDFDHRTTEIYAFNHWRWLIHFFSRIRCFVFLQELLNLSSNKSWGSILICFFFAGKYLFYMYLAKL